MHNVYNHMHPSSGLCWATTCWHLHMNVKTHPHIKQSEQHMHRYLYRAPVSAESASVSALCRIWAAGGQTKPTEGLWRRAGETSTTPSCAPIRECSAASRCTASRPGRRSSCTKWVQVFLSPFAVLKWGSWFEDKMTIFIWCRLFLMTPACLLWHADTNKSSPH